MRTLSVLCSLLLIAAIGCGDPAVTENDNSTSNTATTNASMELDQVDSAGLESALAANSVTLIDFTAVW